MNVGEPQQERRKDMKLGIVGNGMIVKRLLEDIRPLSEVTARAMCPPSEP